MLKNTHFLNPTIFKLCRIVTERDTDCHTSLSHVVAFASSQINKENGMVEASRIMNLYQFIQLYRDITSQAAGVLAAEGATEGPSAPLPSTDSCQASMWMGR